MPCVWPFVLKLDGGTQDCSLILIHSSRNTGLKPCTYIHPPKKQDCCTLEAADCRRNNPDKHNFYCKWALPLLEMEPDEWWKSQSMVKHAPLAEEEDEEDLLIHCFHPLPFSTFLCSPYHLLHRLKYFITSWFVCSKFCLFWYQYQRKCRLLLSQLVDLFLMTPGYFVFHFSLQLEAVGEKEPACFHNNTSWNCEDPPQIGEKKKTFFMFLWVCTSWGKVIKLLYRQGKMFMFLVSSFSLRVFYSLSFVVVLFQTPHMSAFLSVTWMITSRHSPKHLMRLTWMRTPMLDLLYSLSVPTMVMKVGHMKKMQIFVEVKSWCCEVQILPLLKSAEASLFSVSQKLLFISLYCLTPL